MGCGSHGFKSRTVGTPHTTFALLVSLVVVGPFGQVKAFSQNNPWLQSAKVDLARMPDRLFEDGRDTFLNTGNMVSLLVAGAASVAMHGGRADRDIAEEFTRDADFHGFGDEAFNILGSPVSHFPATAAWYVISAHNQDEVSRQRAWTMMTALSVTGFTTLTLKTIRHNDTPSGHSWSWPSGHTASSFTVASALHEFYGLKVGIPAYALACVVAYRMMDTGDHWASDVVFGGTLGWAVGHTIANKHKNPGLAGFDVLPYFAGGDDTDIGVALMRRF